MTTTVAPLTSNAALARMEQAKKLLDSLAQRNTNSRVTIEAARRRRAQLMEQAQAEFGSSNLAELRKLLAEKTRENDEVAAQFCIAVEDYQARTIQIEQALVDPEAREALLQARPQAEELAPTGEAAAANEPAIKATSDIEDL